MHVKPQVQRAHLFRRTLCLGDGLTNPWMFVDLQEKHRQFDDGKLGFLLFALGFVADRVNERLAIAAVYQCNDFDAIVVDCTHSRQLLLI